MSGINRPQPAAAASPIQPVAAPGPGLVSHHARLPGDGTLPSLDQIGLKTGTDKSSRHHNFLGFYERFLAPLRHHSLSVLEIGIYKGQSIAMWAGYFPNARIVGFDVAETATQYATDRIRVEIADQSNIADLHRIGTRHGPFDLIIDDGSHFWDHQITSLQWLFPFLKPGGHYILEDIDTSYGTWVERYQHGATVSAAQYLQKISDYLIGDTALNIAAEPDAFIRTYARKLEFIAFARRTSLLKLRA